MSHATAIAAEVTHWIRANAHPLATVEAEGSVEDLRPVTRAADDAVVIGVGTTTRAGHELAATTHRLLRMLVEFNGFRALALLDDESVVAAMDEYARTGDGDPQAILREAWVPWRNTETLAVLHWARDFNRTHPHDPLRLFGLTPEAAKPAHYEQVSRFVETVAPQRLVELRSHYDPIVTAHRLGEHIQRANGAHPGRPFAEHAKDALALVESLPETTPDVVTAARLILRYHETSTASGHRDFAAESADAADRIANRHERTGERVVYWEGVSNTAVAERLTLHAMSQEFPTTGSLLRQRFGAGYLSVAVAFHHGEVRAGLSVPAPPADFADSVLDTSEHPDYLLDLRTAPAGPVREWLHSPTTLRLVIGTYRPDRDTDHYIAGAGLGDWFDVVLRIRAVTPTHPLT
ncbi:erythromycin esterase [Nocardia transvalensis]|uniref:Erythromycin esterase n=1 Tax=Nocardia transvalensis TaxID=37333 RepID=A0A7W9UG96_9NOCA|nr:erythromycin esterase family protein [Nocardia transvalensis]MBB5912048.1 erythromycin esterase [Nocardia transvalensis]